MNPEYVNLIVIGIVAMFYVFYRFTQWTDKPSKSPSMDGKNIRYHWSGCFSVSFRTC